MPIIFHQDADPEDIVTAVIDDPRWRWIGQVTIHGSSGPLIITKSVRPCRPNDFHMSVLVPPERLDVITDTTIDDIIIEWSGYSGRN